MRYVNPLKLLFCTIAMILSILAFCNFTSYGQNHKTTSPSNSQDLYGLSTKSLHKPKLKYFLVRLHGDNGVSIIDLDGNIVSRNIMPVTNTKGTIDVNNWTTPVLDDIFCVRREKRIGDKCEYSTSIYRNPIKPSPIVGLTDLYCANIVNPNLFPICKHGERIKFVDKNGNVKFTVMPIDGKEPILVSPVAVNGLVIVEVGYDVETKDYVSPDGTKHKVIAEVTRKCGAVDTNGHWVIYPEWDHLESAEDGTMIGWKDGNQKGEEIYRFNSANKPIRDTQFENFGRYYEWPIQGNYIIETVGGDEVRENETNESITNIYDLNQNYITSINNADHIKVNHINKNILNVRLNSSGPDSFDIYNLLDLSNNNTIVSKNYCELDELPNGNYLGWTKLPNNINKYWYVKSNGTKTPLPCNVYFPLNHSLMALFYDTDIQYFFVEGDESTPGYLCDFNGNKVGNILIDEFYNRNWDDDPVESSYWNIRVFGNDD